MASEKKIFKVFPIISLGNLIMATRVPSQSALKPYAAFLMMIYMKFDYRCSTDFIKCDKMATDHWPTSISHEPLAQVIVQ